jgi:hypothetical protein
MYSGGWTVLRYLLISTALLLAATVARAQEPQIEVLGIGAAAIRLSPDSLSGLPVVEHDVTFQTSKGPSSRRYKGVLFWDFLQANNAFEGIERNGELRKTFLVSAKDGYQVAFSIGEIHPQFGNTPLILATEVDGEPVEGGLRIVVPGDKRGARAVYDITKIELR